MITFCRSVYTQATRMLFPDALIGTCKKRFKPGQEVTHQTVTQLMKDISECTTSHGWRDVSKQQLADLKGRISACRPFVESIHMEEIGGYKIDVVRKAFENT